jgi:hypothetical protein
VANFKCVFVYSQPTSKGFSEVYYRTATDIAAASVFQRGFLNYATAMRHPLTILQKIRVSDVLNSRNTAVIPQNLTGTAGSTSLGPDVTGVSAVVNLNAPQYGATRRLWLRGLTDNDVTRNGTSGADTPSPELATAITAWIRVLANNQFCVRSLYTVTTAGYQNQPLASVSGTVGSGMATFTYVGSVNIPLGSRILITRVSPKLLPGVNGYWTVIAAATNQFTVRYNLDQTPPAALTQGQVRLVAYNYGVISANTSRFDHFGTRTTGAGFTAGRGRKRGQHLRSL